VIGTLVSMANLCDVERAVAARGSDVATPFLGLVTTAGSLLAYLHVRLFRSRRFRTEETAGARDAGNRWRALVAF
jgi:hypothetical protein